MANLIQAAKDQVAALTKAAYEKAAQAIGAYATIPCGDAMRYAEAAGITNIHRDTFHAGMGAGRYLLALTWFKTLTGMDISCDSFASFDAPVTDAEREIVIRAVNSTVK